MPLKLSCRYNCISMRPLMSQQGAYNTVKVGPFIPSLSNYY